MTLLGIETSCDETSAAVIRDGRILSNVVSSQIALHTEYGGVVPELATREHLRNLLPVARQALDAAGISARELDAVAATQGPGLPPALMIGLHAAQGAAFALGKPFIGINHHEAHLYSPWIVKQADGSWVAELGKVERSVSLIVSGGHTILALITGPLKHEVIGETIDDAAGECFDKTAKMLGLPYPGGPELDQLAQRGNPNAYKFPRPLLHEKNLDFSFAGLKTSVRYFLEKNPGVVEKGLCDICASVQAAIVEVLVAKTLRAAAMHGVQLVTASGGVTCNSGLRKALEAECREKGYRLLLAAGKFCTDNAAMIGALAEYKFRSDMESTSLDAQIKPSWPLAGVLTSTRPSSSFGEGQ